jgi:hypothetical protein
MVFPFLGKGAWNRTVNKSTASSQGIAGIRGVACARLSKIERYLADNISYSRLSGLRHFVNKET